MRRHGLPNPYEQLKELTRGKADHARGDARASSTRWSCPRPRRQRLLALTPASYTGLAADAGAARAEAGTMAHERSPTCCAARRARATTRCCASGSTPSRPSSPAPGRAMPARIFDFCAAIVDATKDLVMRLQAADRLLRRAARRRPARAADRPHPRASRRGVPVILDAKRGDIGSTAEQYAREAFERYQADAVTLSPFMGFDSIEPYLRYAGKGADPAVPHLQPRRQRPAGAAPGRRGEPALRAHRPAGRRARGTAAASSAWWSAPPSRPRSRACASSRRRCRC